MKLFQMVLIACLKRILGAIQTEKRLLKDIEKELSLLKTILGKNVIDEDWFMNNLP
jgi:hypothetical protein